MGIRIGLMSAAGLLLLAASVAHFLGWGQFAAPLSGVDPEVAAGLKVGWTWGSVAFATFGTVTLAGALAWRRGAAAPVAAAGPVALALVGFGLWALFHRGFNPHFLGFVALGLLVGLPLLGARRAG
jgi:hypothetical protein